MQTEIITTAVRLETLRREWGELRARDVNSTPFQSPEWLLSWWSVFGSGELFTVAVWAGDELIGLAPMFLHPWNGRRQVTFLGTGVSDQLGFLLEPRCRVPITKLLFETILEARDRWDVCDLQDLANEPHLSSNLSSSVTECAICSSIPLPATGAQYTQSLPHGLKRNLRRYRQRLDQLGVVVFEAATDATVSEHVHALIALHRERWQAKDHTDGMLGGKRMAQFHCQAAQSLHRAGVARFFGIRLNGDLIASVYALFENRRAYSYLGGFEPQYASCSPGSLLLEYAIDRAIEEGASKFDLLRGDEPYKLNWGARQRRSYRLVIESAGTLT